MLARFKPGALEDSRPAMQCLGKINGVNDRPPFFVPAAASLLDELAEFTQIFADPGGMVPHRDDRHLRMNANSVRGLFQFRNEFAVLQPVMCSDQSGDVRRMNLSLHTTLTQPQEFC